MENVIKRNTPILPNGILAMLFVIVTEVMFFFSMISAYIVNRASSRIPWPPLDQPRLPIEMTGVNTIILIASGAVFGSTMFFINKWDQNKTKNFLWSSFSLGLLFVLVQGYEWTKLIEYGMSTEKSLFASFFYTIIGAHALHVVDGLIIMLVIISQFLKEPNRDEVKFRLQVLGVYWYFVVLIWPFLYYMVYLY